MFLWFVPWLPLLEALGELHVQLHISLEKPNLRRSQKAVRVLADHSPCSCCEAAMTPL